MARGRSGRVVTAQRTRVLSRLAICDTSLSAIMPVSSTVFSRGSHASQ